MNETQQPFKIERPGEYRTEGGRKALLATSNQYVAEHARWIGWIEGEARAWHGDGRTGTGFPGDRIVDVWVDPVIMDWSLIPPWFAGIAKDSTGVWVAHKHPPLSNPSSHRWVSPSDTFAIPPQYAPKWSGDWVKSWTPRSTEEKDKPNVGLLVEIGTEFCDYVKERTPRDPNCSCHNSAPCSDCTDHRHNRELIEHWESETSKPCYK